MDYFLLQIFAFLRPIMMIEVGYSVGGLGLFDIAAIMLFTITAMAFVSNAALTRNVAFSVTDLIIVTFAVWCLSIYIVYFEDADLKATAKLVLPPLTYIVARNVVRDRERYLQIISVLILGFALPIVFSAALIAAGRGVEAINYWTGIPQYQGAYAGAHTMAHNMTLFIMLTVLYSTLQRGRGSPTWIIPRRIGFAILGGVALFCLYKSGVRTPLLGLLIFAGMYSYALQRRLFVVGAIAGLIAVGTFSSAITSTLLFEIEKVQSGEWAIDQLASGRPAMWKGKLTAYGALPVDRKLGGIGIGSTFHDLGVTSDYTPTLDSHNDYLEVLIQTGGIGFMLFVVLQILLFRRILALPASEKSLFLAVFTAVTVMNLVSNSYVSRFGLGQILYLLLAYIELPKVASNVSNYCPGPEKAGRPPDRVKEA